MVWERVALKDFKNFGPKANLFFLDQYYTQHAVVPGTLCSVSFYVHCT